MEMNRTEIKRGDIFLYDFGNTRGSVQGGVRCAVVVSNNVGNYFSPVVLVCPITSQLNKNNLPTHVLVDYESCGLLKESQILCEQISSVNKENLGRKIGSLNMADMNKLNKALEISVEVGEAGEVVKSGAMKEINKKVKAIKDLDIIIKGLIDKNRSLEQIYEFIEERNARLEELKQLCSKIDVEYEIFYCDEMKGNNRRIG